jgi:tRNA A-37 threonylcarbamoyl transferase component Bud32
MVESLVGRTIGKYKIVEHLGRGGMAEVYKAYQEALDRHVAIKLMHSFLASEQDFMNRFRREARAMAALNHPNIVGVYDFDLQGETSYIVMEYVGGGTLKDRLEQLAQQGETMPLVQTVRIVLEIADALSYAHGRGMVHRDIKPANIMLAEDGHAVLTDFGIAKMLSGPSYTATGAMIGTPAYMSPEQGLGQPGDERSDLYSLGVLFFQMATGRLPFDADTPLAVVLKHVNDPIPVPTAINPSVPAPIQAVIVKAMAKDPNERYQNAHELARDLREAVKTQDLHLVQALPLDLLQDRPTPPPLSTSAGRTNAPAGATRVAAAADVVSPAATVLSAGAASAPGMAGTVVAPRAQGTVVTPGGRTVVPAGGAAGPIEATEISVPVFPEKKKRRSPWLLIAIGAFLLLLVVGAIGAALALGGGGEDEATPTVLAVVTTAPSDTPRPGDTPLPTPTAVDINAAVALALTQAAQEAAGQATNTPEPTATNTPTDTPTPDQTATYIAGCVYGAELVDAYTYSNRELDSAPIGATFPMNWILRNSGTCPWPGGLEWQYVEGEELGQDGSVPVVGIVEPGGETTITTELQAPTGVDTYEIAWQLVDGEGAPFAEPLAFEVRTYRPATATPRATATTPATPTVAATQLDFNVIPGACEYVGTEWRCLVTITPYGGGGGPYTVWVFDSDQPARYFGPGNQTHFITTRRCDPWVHEIRVQDEPSGQSLSKNLFFSPNDLFPGGCVLP